MDLTKKVIIITLLVSSCLCAITNAFSDDNSTIKENTTKITTSPYENIKTSAANAGITYNLTNTNLDILIDQKKLFSAIPSLVANDIIIKVDKNDIIYQPMAVTVFAVGITYTVNIMAEVYAANPQLDNLQVTVYVLPAIGGEKGECYSFDYTRNLYMTLNLNVTNSNDFIANTPGFKFTSWCRSTMEYENKPVQMR